MLLNDFWFSVYKKISDVQYESSASFCHHGMTGVADTMNTPLRALFKIRDMSPADYTGVIWYPSIFYRGRYFSPVWSYDSQRMLEIYCAYAIGEDSEIIVHKKWESDMKNQKILRRQIKRFPLDVSWSLSMTPKELFRELSENHYLHTALEYMLIGEFHQT